MEIQTFSELQCLSSYVNHNFTCRRSQSIHPHGTKYDYLYTADTRHTISNQTVDVIFAIVTTISNL